VRRLERHRKPEITLPTITNLATIVVPSKYPDIFEGCRASLAQFAPSAPKILVRDGESIGNPEGWKVIQGPDEPFVYARNVNLGIQACSGDVLLMNDDVRLFRSQTLETLQAVLATHPSIGILSPRVLGQACNVGCPGSQLVQEADVFVAFVCVLIRRDVFNRIGLLDETFIGYGSEDIDFCRRAREVGYRSATTSAALVMHGHQGTTCSTSHDRERKRNPEAYSFRPELSDRRYAEKWGGVDARPQTQPKPKLKTEDTTGGPS
jgi:hypothetical protein